MPSDVTSGSLVFATGLLALTVAGLTIVGCDEPAREVEKDRAEVAEAQEVESVIDALRLDGMVDHGEPFRAGSGPVLPSVYSSRTMSADERAALREAKASAPQQVTLQPKVSARLAARMGAGDSDEMMTIIVLVQEPEWPGTAAHMAMLRTAGLVSDADEEDFWATELAVERDRRVASAQAPAVRAIEAVGGTVLWQGTALAAINAQLRPEMVRRLEREPSIMMMELDSVGVRQATGVEVITGSQIKQFVDTQNNGSYGTDIHFAHVDLDPYHDEHPGFQQGDGNLTTRIAGKYVCTTVSCAAPPGGNFPLPGPTVPEQHATYTAGIVFGDLRDAQDPVYPGADTTNQIQRSGYAGEARGYLYQISTESSAVVAFNHILGRSPLPRVVSMPVGFVDPNTMASVDPNCLGQTPSALKVNTLYESGILAIISAGNTGHSSTTDCTVLPPATAMGAFAVGAHGNGAGTTADVRTASIYTASARGGTTTQGGFRSIIDLTAYAYRSKLFDRTGGYANFAVGTSIAAPTVAAAAIDFIDFYKTKNAGSTLIDSPGILAANMLLMGDRFDEAGGNLTIHFDRLWGGGRLKMRKFDEAGMDTPWYYETNWTCISDGESFFINVNGGATTGSAVNDFKAVIYWYDRNHGTDGVDDIDLVLTGGGLLVPSSSGSDEKERVYTAQAANKALKLEITGYDVTSDNEGCGTNANKVYWAFFYEDDARDDANGPLPSEIDPE